MKSSRQAVMRVDRELLEQIMPDWQIAAQLRYDGLLKTDFWMTLGQVGIMRDKAAAIAEPYHQALKLPANCRITGISVHHAFQRDQIAFRIESPDFVETPFLGMLPDVRAVYQNGFEFVARCVDGNLGKEAVTVKSATGYFLCWDGPAVAVKRTWGPDGEEVNVAPRLMRTPSTEQIEDLYDVLSAADASKAAEGALFDEATLKKQAWEIGVDQDADLKSVPTWCVESEAGQDPEEKPPATLNGLPVTFSKDVGPAPCWQCGRPTTRRLPDLSDVRTQDPVAECPDCARKPLF